MKIFPDGDLLCRRIGRGRGLTASPLPPPPDRRVTKTAGRQSKPADWAHPDRRIFSRGASAPFSPGLDPARRLAGGHCATPPPAPRDRAGRQPVDTRRRCPRRTSAGRSRRLAPPAVRAQAIPQRSRGQPWPLLRIDARLTAHVHACVEDCGGPCPLVPGVSRLVAGACSSPRACAPRGL